MKMNIYNEDGRKYTLSEYFKNVNSEGMFEIISKRNGHCITGTYDHIFAVLRKDLFSSCIQEIDVDDYGTTLIIR